ncbi:PAS domain S-box protein [Pseudenhygromyxa sp. WMMC2535]|uniref:two-component system sensor histidine kinase NtrB n=1 Tax=Pseudenhygromyxa sp. WMMC2535 TaxID=2712867 RepID=UPI0015543490|nr:ATP-binding protein [Pseudenhygromyxa sp. WMMC2535]NVB36705.1 PAS domain S-box protein [Pseudenhygromyxa sp. WMMC2535]
MTAEPVDSQVYRRLLERTSELALRVRLGPPRVVEYLSPAFAELLGLPLADCYAELATLEARVLPEDAARLALPRAGGDAAEVAAEGEPFTLRFLDSAGRPRSTAARQWLVEDEGGLALELLARPSEMFGQGLGERDFAQRLCDTAHAIVLVLDPEGRIVFFNPFMRELSGYELDEVRGRDWFKTFIVEDERPRISALFEQAIDDLEIVANVNAIRTKSGGAREIEWYGKTLHDSQGKIVGLLSVGWDVTDRRALEGELARAQHLASIGTLASTFAHEVGNPLNGMYLQVQMLERRLGRIHEDEPLLLRVEAIKSEILRLNALLEEFRSLNRPQALSLRAMELRGVLEGVLARQVRPLAPEGVRVESEIAPGLPPVLGNADKLEQVFLNLCKNAIEAMPEGGTLVVRARAGGKEGRVLVDIVDTGTGIPDELDVFEPFCTTKVEGTGLGLPLVREIMRAHGGKISYASEIGRGTCFTVELQASG